MISEWKNIDDNTIKITGDYKMFIFIPLGAFFDMLLGNTRYVF